MILLALATALASPPALTDELQPAWTTDAFRSVDVDRTGCEVSPRDEAPLPAGLPVEAKWLYQDACGDSYAYVRVPLALGARRSEWWFTPVDGIRLTPPRRLPRAPSGTGETVWLGAGTPNGHAMGLTPSTQDEGRAFFFTGESFHAVDVEGGAVLDEAGRLWLFSPLNLKPEDPLVGIRDDQDRLNQERLVAGRARHPAPIVPIPPAEVLDSDTVDAEQAYLFRLRRRDLTEQRRFSPDWLDPVGQVVEAPCDDAHRYELQRPCGRYYLDYSAFGAWWPRDTSTELLVVHAGTERVDGERLPHLRVLVRDALDHVESSPDW